MLITCLLEEVNLAGGWKQVNASPFSATYPPVTDLRSSFVTGYRVVVTPKTG
jgi:hypothetical protein